MICGYIEDKTVFSENQPQCHPGAMASIHSLNVSIICLLHGPVQWNSGYQLCTKPGGVGKRVMRSARFFYNFQPHFVQYFYLLSSILFGNI